MTPNHALSVLEHASELRETIVRQNVRDIVCDKIASLIAAGMLQIGDVLPSERDLATALHVSRETVRGAMQRLAVGGIIEVSQGARTRVVSVDVGPVTAGTRAPRLINNYGIDEVHAARLLVERQVVADAARHIDEATLDLLEDLLAAQSLALDDPVRFLISDREFHLAIYKAAGNPVLGDFVGELYAYMMEHRRKAVSRKGAITLSFEDHVAIVAALRRRDPEAVVAAFDVHLDRIYTTTRSILGKAGPPPGDDDT